MTPFALEQGYIATHHVAMLAEARRIVEQLPDGLSCHDVCAHLVGSLNGVRHARGRFNGWDHSWLVIVGTQVVIDAYPWACGSGPILVDTQDGSPWAALYAEQMRQYPEPSPLLGLLRRFFPRREQKHRKPPTAL